MVGRKHSRTTRYIISPGEVIANIFAPVLHQYDISKISGDRHAQGFVAAALRSCGITFEPTKLSKSELYGELLPLVNTGMVELLDLPTLRTQLLALQRRSVRGGKDSIDHPAGAHDDLANVCAGALTLVTGVGVKQKKRVRVAGDHLGAQGLRDQSAAFGVMATAINARLDRQAERDWQMQKLYENEPMISEPVWHVHHRR